jgi:hypothetical protein
MVIYNFELPLCYFCRGKVLTLAKHYICCQVSDLLFFRLDYNTIFLVGVTILERMHQIQRIIDVIIYYLYYNLRVLLQLFSSYKKLKNVSLV